MVSFIFKVFEEKKQTKIPTQIFWHCTVGRGGQTNIFFFWPNCDMSKGWCARARALVTLLQSRMRLKNMSTSKY